MQESCLITEEPLLNISFSSQNVEYKFKLDLPNF